MFTLYKEFTGSFYDADYYENGKRSGKGWLENYHWMPRRSFKEAFAFIDYLELDESHFVLDFGCAKGFIVRAMRELEIKCEGCDISTYALSFAPEGCWDASIEQNWEGKKYTHIIAKDVFEHLTPAQLDKTLEKLGKLALTMMCVIPLGEHGRYVIPEYHTEISHLIAENIDWWKSAFEKAGWHFKKGDYHINGLKDNWAYCLGNYVFVLERDAE